MLASAPMGYSGKLLIGAMMLVLQMGLAHAVQHDLHDFDPSALTIEHDESDCLLADTPHAKADVPPAGFQFMLAENQRAQNIVTRHALRHYPKHSPRAPPFYL